MIRPLAIVAMILCATLASTARANLLLNGDFEADPVTSPNWYIRDGVHPSNWTQFGDGVDLIHTNYGQIPAQSGSQYLDLNQENPNNLLGGIRQDVAVTPGQSYELSLWSSRWGFNANGTIRYSLMDVSSNQTLATDTYTVTPDWVNRTLQATATGSTLRVQIQSIVSQQAAPGLDNVSLTLVPEPASVALLAVMTLVAMRRRAIPA
ncbi:MAG: DUF642 domain-containing protein [Phycisphaerales bacterium]